MDMSLFKKGLIVMLAVSLSACGADMDDLDTEINRIKSQPGGRIDPLPEITPYESFAYMADAEGLRSPFRPDTPQTAGPGSGIRPVDERVKEYLERYPLDTLRMVGTLNLGGTDYGLIQTEDGLVHRVIPGNFMGQNDGRITIIEESAIQLVEIISDGIGGYVERDAAVGLSD